MGLGLRAPFLTEVAQGPKLDVAFFEISPENSMRSGGASIAALERVVERYPVVTHGLTMSLGGTEPPCDQYMHDLAREIRRCRTPWHSDHLCFSTAGPVVLHDLVPLQHSMENVSRVADRLRRAQDQLGLPMAIENISWYAHPGRMEMAEAEFIGRVLDVSGCSLLLDVNNVWVNASNHGFDPYGFIGSLPLDRVIELHVAGHSQLSPELTIDTHGEPVCDPVLALLEWTLERTGPVAVLLERDSNIPPLSELLDEVRALAAIHERAAEAHHRRRSERSASEVHASRA